ncbi:hypothetical protein ACT8ZR_28150 [Neobacillus sp. M.A.Huq-85]|nr:hypothetical protein QNK12_18485 [Neobacillus cucumis]
MIFHYHFWTPHLEETEKFYQENGFRISQRLGKYKGDFQTFNPPLTWDDFREKKILFRIIEARKGAVNITFGYGKRIMFDHIGFLVSKEEKGKISENAENMNWAVDRGERRTFITTPYHFRIELQSCVAVVDSISDNIKINKLTLETKIEGLDKGLSQLFGGPVNQIISDVGNEVMIKEAVINGFLSSNVVDPNGVKVFNNI